MLQTVLAGADGKSPAIDQLTGQPLTMEELLRRRGILAVGGNSRLMPFSENAGNDASSSATAVALLEDKAPKQSPHPVMTDDGTRPSVSNDGSPIPGIPKAKLDEMSDDDINELSNNLGPILGAGVAAGIANYLLTRKRTPKLAEGAASATAATAENNAAVGQRQIGDATAKQADIIDGEFYEVHPNKSLPNQSAMKELGAPDVVDLSKPTPVGRSAVAGALMDRTQAKSNTRREVGARQSVQSRVQPSNEAPVYGRDSYSDLSDAEHRQAVTLRDQLIADRIAGRKSKVRGRAGGSTADINPDGVFNEIVALIRKNKNLTRGLSRIR